MWVLTSQEITYEGQRLDNKNINMLNTYDKLASQTYVRVNQGYSLIRNGVKSFYAMISVESLVSPWPIKLLLLDLFCVGGEKRMLYYVW